MIEQSHSSLFVASLGILGNQASTGMSIRGSSVQQLVLAAPTASLPSQLPSNSKGTSGAQAVASSTDSNASDRKELPAGFFTSLYPPAAPTMPGWQKAPQFGMGYAMQYPAGMISLSFSY